jgi:hypothetical protein
MGTSTLLTFRILKILKSHTSMSLKIMTLKYIGRYLQDECMQKSPVKNNLYFAKYKIDKFLIVNSSKIIYLFVSNLYFLYFLKYKVFFNGTFLRMLFLYKSFYVFKAIIFSKHRSVKF